MTEHRRLVRDEDASAARATNLVVLGTGRRAQAVAANLTDCVDSVTLVGRDADDGRVPEGLDAVAGSITNAAEVRALGDAEGPVDAVVAVGPDSEALLAGYLARRELDPETVIATVNDPDRGAAFENTGVEPLDVSALLADHIRARLERPPA